MSLPEGQVWQVVCQKCLRRQMDDDPGEPHAPLVVCANHQGLHIGCLEHRHIVSIPMTENQLAAIITLGAPESGKEPS